MSDVKLGYEHDVINETVDYSCTKLGGTPIWPSLKDLDFQSRCPLCNLHRPLILQCYAPLQNSAYHRILYIFACVNPTCWNKSESWICLRSQLYDSSFDQSLTSQNVESSSQDKSWCSQADDWGDDDNFGSDISFGDFTVKSLQPEVGNFAKISDDDDEDDDIDINNVHELENRIQNINFNQSGTNIKNACAEIEGEESQVIVDTPLTPQRNIADLLHQLPELPKAFRQNDESIKFIPKYVYVVDEYLPTNEKNIGDKHVVELLQNYEKEHKNDVKIIERTKKVTSMLTNIDNSEEYERDNPLHGNELFHHFLTKIQYNPGQIIRYSIGGQPLILNNLPNGFSTKKCKNCNGPIQFELQLLSTMIPSLQIIGSSDTHLEFGTVLIYTCRSSCWKDTNTIIEEYCIVQAEPL